MFLLMVLLGLLLIKTFWFWQEGLDGSINPTLIINLENLDGDLITQFDYIFDPIGPLPG